jgi:nitrogen-specific signal transduction histidine kinase
MPKQDLPSSERPSVTTSPVATIGNGIESLPCATALWAHDHSCLSLNARARSLTGFTQGDLQRDPGLWLSRIHPDDQPRYLAVWASLQGNSDNTICDYRFFPVERGPETWLREVSVLRQRIEDKESVVISTYITISDLKTESGAGLREKEMSNRVDVIDDLVHELQNNLHGISMGLDLLGFAQPDLPEYRAIFQRIERTSGLLRDVREYFFPPKFRYSEENLAATLVEVAQGVEKEWRQRRLRVTVHYRTQFPLLQFDWGQLCSAFERVLAFACALLGPDEELRIEAGLRQIDEQRYIEITIPVPLPPLLAGKDKDVFEHFLRVNNYQAGLSLDLGRQSLRRQHGDISFHRDSPQHGSFLILLQA